MYGGAADLLAPEAEIKRAVEEGKLADQRVHIELSRDRRFGASAHG